MEKKNENHKETNIPISDETESTTRRNRPNPFAGLTSSDKSFVGTVIAIVLLYLGKRFFDSSDKAMERGYEVKVTAKQYGDLTFKPGDKKQETTETEDSGAEEESDPEKEALDEAPTEENSEKKE